MFPAEFSEVLKIFSCYIHVFSYQAGSWITGCNKKLITQRALTYFPRQRMFSASVANNQDVHGRLFRFQESKITANSVLRNSRIRSQELRSQKTGVRSKKAN